MSQDAQDLSALADRERVLRGGDVALRCEYCNGAGTVDRDSHPRSVLDEPQTVPCPVCLGSRVTE